MAGVGSRARTLKVWRPGARRLDREGGAAGPEGACRRACTRRSGPALVGGEAEGRGAVAGALRAACARSVVCGAPCPCSPRPSHPGYRRASAAGAARDGRDRVGARGGEDGGEVDGAVVVVVGRLQQGRRSRGRSCAAAPCRRGSPAAGVAGRAEESEPLKLPQETQSSLLPADGAARRVEAVPRASSAASAAKPELPLRPRASPARSVLWLAPLGTSVGEGHRCRSAPRLAS